MWHENAEEGTANCVKGRKDSFSEEVPLSCILTGETLKQRRAAGQRVWEVQRKWSDWADGTIFWVSHRGWHPNIPFPPVLLQL